MGLDNMSFVKKSEYMVKTLLFGLWAVYLCYSHTQSGRIMNDKMLYDAKSQKENISDKKVAILIIGGSNAMTGLSANQIEESLIGIGDVLNLSLPAAEGAGKINYPEWLSFRITEAKTVIYSSMDFWHLSGNAPFNLESQHPSDNFSAPPLYKFIKNISAKYHFDSKGDWLDYNCTQPDYTEVASMVDLNLVSARMQELKERLDKLKIATNAQQIFLRIPPILVTENNVNIAKAYLEAAELRLRQSGINIFLQKTYITSDLNSMCFGGNHPNKLGRFHFTTEIVEQLNNYSNAESTALNIRN